MTLRKLLAAASLGLCAAAAWAQAPSPATPAATVPPIRQPDSATDNRDQTKATTEGARQQDNFRTQRNLGRTPSFPHQIKDEGIKMPKCAQESREGEACK